MNILEKEIEELVWDAMTTGRGPLLRQKGLPVYESFTFVRQMDLGNYGRADIVGLKYIATEDTEHRDHPELRVDIIELKKEKITMATLLQAVRYAKGIECKLESEGFDCNCVVSFRFILIGKEVDKDSDFVYLPDYAPNILLYTYSLDFEFGILFKEQFGFSLTNNGFGGKPVSISRLIDLNRSANNHSPISEPAGEHEDEEEDLEDDDMPF